MNPTDNMQTGVKEEKEGVLLADRGSKKFLADLVSKKYTFFVDFDVATFIFNTGLLIPYSDDNWTSGEWMINSDPTLARRSCPPQGTKTWVAANNLPPGLLHVTGL